MSDDEMISDDEFFAPRILGGAVVRFMPTADGGAEVMLWGGEAWIEADISAGDLMAEGREASPEALEARGIQGEEPYGKLMLDGKPHTVPYQGYHNPHKVRLIEGLNEPSNKWQVGMTDEENICLMMNPDDREDPYFVIKVTEPKNVSIEFFDYDGWGPENVKIDEGDSEQAIRRTIEKGNLPKLDVSIEKLIMYASIGHQVADKENLKILELSENPTNRPSEPNKKPPRFGRNTELIIFGIITFVFFLALSLGAIILAEYSLRNP